MFLRQQFTSGKILLIGSTQLCHNSTKLNLTNQTAKAVEFQNPSVILRVSSLVILLLNVTL